MHKLVRSAALASLTAALLLTGCTKINRDGPPPYNVDVSKIPDAVPKSEPLAKYGNMRFYNVFGRRYYTLKSSSHYDKVGVASWYGSKFHARKTSSGEPYNMLSMTAAHKTLPLPTYVEVTNLRNHRRIIVKVNDRGPFSSDRLIDLSYVAAKKLGMIGHGTTNVRVRAIDPDTFNNNHFYAQNKQTEYPRFANKKIRIAKPTDAVFLQVGAFKNLAYAKRLQNRLSGHIGAPVLISREGNHSQLFRVKIGPIKDVASSKHIASMLKRKGLNPRTIV